VKNTDDEEAVDLMERDINLLDASEIKKGIKNFEDNKLQRGAGDEGRVRS
jgi:hypothetical protein